MSATADVFDYPWDGGSYVTNGFRVYEPDEDDGAGDVLGEWVIGLGDYCDEGAPDLLVKLAADTPRQHVEWVAHALWAAAVAHRGPTGG